MSMVTFIDIILNSTACSLCVYMHATHAHHSTIMYYKVYHVFIGDTWYIGLPSIWINQIF